VIEDRNLKPGTALVGRYKDKEYRAKVIAGKDGKVRYRLADGREFKSPSGAGSAVMGGVACNGWRFWGKVQAAARTTTKQSKVGRRRPPASSRRKTKHVASKASTEGE
jgi:hypothetical protein